MVARLIHLNGPPGVGKSTLARRYVDLHPGTLRLDPDELGALIGGGRGEQPEDLASIRDVALAAASAYLQRGRDVIVPQLIARSEELDRFYVTARSVDAELWSVMLMDELPVLVERCRARQAQGHRPIVTPMQIGDYRDRLLSLAEEWHVPVIADDRVTSADSLRALLNGSRSAMA